MIYKKQKTNIKNKKLLYIYSYTQILSVFLIEKLVENEEEENL